MPITYGGRNGGLPTRGDLYMSPCLVRQVSGSGPRSTAQQGTTVVGHGLGCSSVAGTVGFGAPSERFWAKVDRSAGHDGCWPWTGLFFRGGYGRFWVGPGIDIPAHVWAWEQVNGPVPAGLQLDHFRCDNPPCVNPAHLRPTTPRENTLRGNTITAFNLAKTHCPQDHPYDETNTYWRRDGARACRKCQRVFQAAYEQRRRGSSS